MSYTVSASAVRIDLWYAAPMENQYLSDTRFDSFGLDDRLLASLQEAGFERCSRNSGGNPAAGSKSGRDVTGQAQTGTGKTGAFLVAVFQRLARATHRKSTARFRALSYSGSNP